MSIRVHELAKRCGLSNKDMVEKLHAMNYPVKSHSSTVDKITAESIEKEYGYVPAPPPVPVATPEPKPVEVPAPPPLPPAPGPIRPAVTAAAPKPVVAAPRPVPAMVA